LEEEKQRIFDRIAAEVTAKQREQEEFLELQIVLSMQEAEEKRVREDKARAEKRLRDKVEMMAANEHQKVKTCFRARCVRVAMAMAMADDAAAGDQGADTGAGGGGRGEVPPAHVSQLSLPCCCSCSLHPHSLLQVTKIRGRRKDGADGGGEAAHARAGAQEGGGGPDREPTRGARCSQGG
jgi:hypothetical protein